MPQISISFTKTPSQNYYMRCAISHSIATIERGEELVRFQAKKTNVYAAYYGAFVWSERWYHETFKMSNFLSLSTIVVVERTETVSLLESPTHVVNEHAKMPCVL